MKHPWLWFLPLAGLVVSSAGLILAGILAWGAAENPRYADWIPTFAGVCSGGVCLLGAILGAFRLRRSLSVPCHVRSASIAIGLIAILFLIFVTAASIPLLDDSSRYSGASPDEIDAAFQREGAWGQRPHFSGGSPNGFVITTIVAIFPGPISWCLAAMYLLYAKGFQPVSRDVPPIDALGEIMKTT